MKWKPQSMWTAVKKMETDAYIQGLKDAMRALNKDPEIYRVNIQIVDMIEEARNDLRS